MVSGEIAQRDGTRSSSEKNNMDFFFAKNKKLNGNVVQVPGQERVQPRDRHLLPVGGAEVASTQTGSVEEGTRVPAEASGETNGCCVSLFFYLRDPGNRFLRGSWNNVFVKDHFVLHKFPL